MANKFIPLADLNGTNGDPAPEWIRLLPQHRAVLTYYISNGYEKEAAVKSVYKCASQRSTCTTISRIFGIAEVRAFLSVHFGETELDRYKEEVRRVLNGKKISQQRLGALRILAKANGINLSNVGEFAEASARAEEKIVAEKEFEKDGRKFRTTVTEVAE